VVLAHQLALESPLIQADMIEANEFYDFAMRYNVSGVPQTTINDGLGTVLGAVPEEYLVQEIKRII
jgi:predicted DsbA family dithiol-disulfide isomerase